MTFCVKNVNNTDRDVPTTVTELVSFINHIQQQKNEVFVQISNYEIEVVKEVAKHFNCNFYDWDEMEKVGLNPYTIIYIDQDDEIKSHAINEKSKIVIYAKRPVSNN